MADETVHLVERGPIIEVTLNRPDKLNAMTPAMTGVISKAVDELARRHDLRLMLIRAKGRYFSAGSDFVGGEIPDFRGSTMAARHWYRGGVDRESLQSINDKLEAVEKPVVVAHHGPCLGGALEMSLSCDFRLAAKSARAETSSLRFMLSQRKSFSRGWQNRAKACFQIRILKFEACGR